MTAPWIPLVAGLACLAAGGYALSRAADAARDAFRLWREIRQDRRRP